MPARLTNKNVLFCLPLPCAWVSVEVAFTGMGVTIPASSWLQRAHPHGEVPNESPQFIAGHVESTLYCVLFPTVLVTVVLLCFSRFRQKQHGGLQRFGESRQLM